MAKQLPRVTLTFDNGPTAGTTPFVLEQLHIRNLSAYFCVIGKKLSSADEHVDIARETLRLGHRLVNHTYDHATTLGEKPTDDHAQHEIDEMDQLMQDLLGDWGEKWFRPYGKEGRMGPHLFSSAALNRLEELSYSVLLWNSVPRDWVNPTDWIGPALTDIRNQQHTLIVLHDIDSGAMQLLPRFLDQLQESGVTTTLDLPDSCVPMRNGRLVFDHAEMSKLNTFE